jgi:hypothetical protein
MLQLQCTAHHTHDAVPYKHNDKLALNFVFLDKGKYMSNDIKKQGKLTLYFLVF